MLKNENSPSSNLQGGNGMLIRAWPTNCQTCHMSAPRVEIRYLKKWKYMNSSRTGTSWICYPCMSLTNTMHIHFEVLHAL